MSKKSKFIVETGYNGGYIVAEANTLKKALKLKDDYVKDFLDMNGYDPNCGVLKLVGTGYLPL